ncbi:MAG: hypothetical protein ACPL6C_03925 [bacterium]
MNIASIILFYSSALIIGQGGVSTGVIQSPDALLYNPAIISRNIAASLTYANPYGIQGLNYFNFGLSYRGISIAGAQLALNELYTEQTIFAGYRRKFKRRLDIGLGLGFHYIRIRGYNDVYSAVATGGIRYKIGPTYICGNFLKHTRERANFTDEEANKFPDRYSLGFSLNLPQSVNWTVEWNPGEYVRGGVDIAFTNGFSVRMGIYDKSRFTLGFGLSTYNVGFDFAILEHRELGESLFFTLKAFK